jgi:hypothetical protein
MTDIAPVTHVSVGQAASVSSAVDRHVGGAATGPGTAREADRVEVSPVARYLSLLREAPVIRADLVSEVRDLIESDAYETPERIEGAVDALMEEEPWLLD